MSFINFQVPYKVDERYSKKVAYFSMEFAIHQATEDLQRWPRISLRLSSSQCI
jgi:hypothetical protein